MISTVILDSGPYYSSPAGPESRDRLSEDAGGGNRGSGAVRIFGSRADGAEGRLASHEKDQNGEDRKVAHFSSPYTKYILFSLKSKLNLKLF